MANFTPETEVQSYSEHRDFKQSSHLLYDNVVEIIFSFNRFSVPVVEQSRPKSNQSW